jgi:hypothetical protein
MARKADIGRFSGVDGGEGEEVKKYLCKIAERAGLEFIGCTYAALEPKPDICWMIYVYQKPDAPYFHFVIFEEGVPAKAYKGTGSPHALVDYLSNATIASLNPQLVEGRG